MPDFVPREPAEEGRNEFFEITRAEANLLSRFSYTEDSNSFDPYAGEQRNGNFLLERRLWISLQDHANIQRIDFSRRPVIALANIDLRLR